DHGTCIVTSNNAPYCLCDSGYEQNGATVCKQSTTANPCSGQKCSDHGTCLVTGNNEPYCLCDYNYKNDGATKCVAEHGVSNGQAYPTETVDPWGLVWDSQERPPQTHSNAAATCAAIGGRLPMPYEIVRNNHTSGEKGVGNISNANVLWTDMRTWNNYFHAYRLSDGTATDQVVTTPTAFRCVWDPAPRPITLTGVNCYGNSNEDGCVHIKIGNYKYTVDRRDRPANYYIQAAEECRLAGGRLPTNNEMMMLIRNGLPNGTGNWVWSGVTDGNFGVHKWTGTGSSSYNYSGEWSYAGWTAAYYYRCISEEVELTDGKPTFPQTKAADAFVVDPLLRIDKHARVAKTVWEASYECMQDGGHLAELDEMTLAVRKGLKLAETWHVTGTSYGGYQFDIHGNPSYVAPYYNQNGYMSYAALTTALPFYCAYRPNRVYDEADFEKKATDGYAWKYEQKFEKGSIKYFIRDKNEASAGGSDCIQDSISASGKNMFLPTVFELAFAVRHGLPGGNQNYLMTSTTCGWLSYRTLKWSGTENESFDPQANYSSVGWNGTNGYRSFISSVIK
ncbi:MAG: hypothetical protein IJU23_12895, partial [Proteobacteria bacterium]|nr:hypothetical protein [Pseudomonadota bacterium]